MAKGAFDSLHVLIIDDNVHMRDVVETLLRALGVGTISLASNGQEALGLLRSEPIDIVLCDLEMEPRGGLDFIREMRANGASPNPFVPIIVVSGHTEKHNVVMARDAGATEFLAKPISALELYERIRSVIAHPRPFVRTKSYFGPDRRRRLEDFYSGTERRADDEVRNRDHSGLDDGGLDDGDLERRLGHASELPAPAGD